MIKSDNFSRFLHKSIRYAYLVDDSNRYSQHMILWNIDGNYGKITIVFLEALWVGRRSHEETLRRLETHLSKYHLVVVNVFCYICHKRGIIKNNVDFYYKKLSSHHRLIQTIPFSFGNRMGSENKIFILILSILFCAVYLTMVTGTRGSSIICTHSIPLTAYKTIINQRICLYFCHNEVLCHLKIS